MQFQRLSPCGAPGLHVLRRIPPRGARLAAASLQLATPRPIRQTLVLSALLAALLATACGGGDAPPASGTPSTERAERQQTVAQQTTATQQQAQAEAEESTASQAAEQPDPQPDPQPEAVAQQQEAQAAAPDQAVVEAEVEDESQQTITFDDQLVEQIAGTLAAHRAGLPTARNVLGDPAAPVLIVEYGDFQ